jgi:hypothetical protein
MVIAGAALITIAAILTDHLGYALIFGLISAGMVIAIGNASMVRRVL